MDEPRLQNRICAVTSDVRWSELPDEELKSPELQASLAKLGLQTKSMTPREFAAKPADEARDWEAAVTESGVKID
jgi:tripartite-type tricarboxylate transporter receptor subunit TctC